MEFVTSRRSSGVVITRKQKFRDYWETLMRHAKGEIPLWIKVEILIDALDDSSELKADMLFWMRANKEVPCEENASRYYSDLVGMLEECIVREKTGRNQAKRREAEERYRDSMLKSSKSKPEAPAAPGVGGEEKGQEQIQGQGRK